MKLPGKVVAHTAASVSKDILKPVTEHYGVFYPLQSLRKESSEIPEAPIFFDGADEKTINKLKSLAHSISPEHVAQAGDMNEANYTSQLLLLAILPTIFMR
jgi:predicted short-subunit dehydrogenase-like oxidoreductase (DUF2520 family)